MGDAAYWVACALATVAAALCPSPAHATVAETCASTALILCSVIASELEFHAALVGARFVPVLAGWALGTRAISFGAAVRALRFAGLGGPGALAAASLWAHAAFFVAFGLRLGRLRRGTGGEG
jgi:hypothetical protein